MRHFLAAFITLAVRSWAGMLAVGIIHAEAIPALRPFGFSVATALVALVSLAVSFKVTVNE